jgi:hypothetical protein
VDANKPSNQFRVCLPISIWQEFIPANQWLALSTPLWSIHLFFSFMEKHSKTWMRQLHLEVALREELGDSAVVDGHDVGSGETNIFI